MGSGIDYVHEIMDVHMSTLTLRRVTEDIVSKALLDGIPIDFIIDLLKTTSHEISTGLSLTDRYYWNAPYVPDPARSRRTHEGSTINCLVMSVLEKVLLPDVQSPETMEAGHSTPRNLRRIFLDDREFQTFYVDNGATHHMSPMAVQVNGDYAVVPMSGASLYFVELLNWFGHIGGYDAIVNRLRGTIIPMTLEEMLAYAAVFCVGRFCFTKSFYKKYWKDVFQGFQIRIEGFSIIQSKDTDMDAAVRTIALQLESVVDWVYKGRNVAKLCPDKCVFAMKYGTGSRFAFLSALVA